ncbi:MAG: hypothetical protein ACRDO8_04620 [Nocardioidaceae bacterium]
MTRPADRVWLCAIDLNRWSEVAQIIPSGYHPSARLGQTARIAAATSNALVSIAAHELAAPEIDRSSGLALGGSLQPNASRPLEQVHHSVSHNDLAIAVVTSLDPIGVAITSAEELGTQAAQDLARDRAARKVLGGTTGSTVDEDLLIAGPGWCEIDDNRIWIDDIAWHEDFAISVAATGERELQVISTTASTILDHWRDAVEGRQKPSAPGAHGSHRTSLG